MGAKVSADESHMENISIKNRPMTVADDYHNFMADVWSDAKEKLDAEVSKMDNKDRLTLLSDILMVITCLLIISNSYVFLLYNDSEKCPHPHLMFTSFTQQDTYCNMSSVFSNVLS